MPKQRCLRGQSFFTSCFHRKRRSFRTPSKLQTLRSFIFVRRTLKFCELRSLLAAEQNSKKESCLISGVCLIAPRFARPSDRRVADVNHSLQESRRRSFIELFYQGGTKCAFNPLPANKSKSNANPQRQQKPPPPRSSLPLRSTSPQRRFVRSQAKPTRTATATADSSTANVGSGDRFRIAHAGNCRHDPTGLEAKRSVRLVVATRPPHLSPG